ncbi:YdcH family protein [Labrenzia sp. CE80]|uniref:YdcH family protein n=1 Tax=Labrenzia sp. CE80 TaxID=1788986 RepID=UPI00129A32FC|nr:YdcH family protein [Labrenzia sp. CE80]
MSHVPHELHEEFPDAADALHALKASDAHFVKLSDEYHAINREIHRIETDVEPASDETLEDLKKKRLSLKDQIAAILAVSERTGS